MAAIPELKERVRRLFYPAYEARMVKALPKDRIPQHIGVMLDGNRRWAKGVGGDSTHGYRAGAANIEPLLEWSEEVGVAGRHAVAALDRQPQPAARAARGPADA